MRQNRKIDAAREASSKIGKALGDAIFELEFHFESPLNPHGCLNDIKGVKADIGTAIEVLEKALTMINEIDWPTDAEYEATWEQKHPHLHIAK